MALITPPPSFEVLRHDMYGGMYEKESVWPKASPFGAEPPSVMNLDANGVSYRSTRLVYTVNKMVSVHDNVINNRQCDRGREPTASVNETVDGNEP